MDYESSVAPHPSYQLEDSSEGSDWEQDESPKMKQLSPEPTISLTGHEERIKKGGQVVFLIGEAGERVAQGIEVKAEELIKVVIDGAQVSERDALLLRTIQLSSHTYFLTVWCYRCPI